MASANMSEISVEIHFAQRLASNEKRIRDRALRKLRKWFEVKSCSKEDPFTEVDFIKLWKGLHYCLWMQDKPLLQEELTDRITQLIHVFKNEDCAMLFLGAFFKTEMREWDILDKWRVDKFMMLVRRMLNQALCFLKDKCWSDKVLSHFTDIVSTSIMNPSVDGISENLRIHLSDIYLDELEKTGAGQLTSQQVISFLEPFFLFLPKAKNTDILKRIIKSVFEALIKQSVDDAVESARKRLEKEGNADSESDSDKDEIGDNEDEDEDSPTRLDYDFDGIADRLFKLGSNSECIGRNRAVIFDLVTKFRDLQKGVFTVEEVIPPGISRRMKEKESKKAKNKKRIKAKKAKLKELSDDTVDVTKKKKRKRKQSSGSNEDNTSKEQELDTEDLEEVPKKKKNKMKLEKENDSSELSNCHGDSECNESKKVKSKKTAKKNDRNLQNNYLDLELDVKQGTNDDAGSPQEVFTSVKKKSKHGKKSVLTENNGKEERKKLQKHKNKTNRAEDACIEEKEENNSSLLSDKTKRKIVNDVLQNLSESMPSGRKMKKLNVNSVDNLDDSGISVGSKKHKNRHKQQSYDHTDSLPVTPVTTTEDTTGDSLLQDEVDIWIPSKKYKGKLKGLYEKEKIKNEKLLEEATSKEVRKTASKSNAKNNFAQFENLVKAPPAFVRKAVSRVSTPGLKESKKKTVAKTPKSAPAGNRKRVSFGLHQNQSQDFEDSLLMKTDPFDPIRTPDQGILKVTSATKSQKSSASVKKGKVKTADPIKRALAVDFF